jgi:N,N-dimethylformamidase
VELGRSEQILLDHPELGASSYDQYLDGSNITLVSWLRPNLDMRAAQRREENYPSDLHLIAWLERQGYRYDVITDHDVDREGIGLLERYRVVVTGTHPEYVTSRGVNALEQYVSSGGRLAVLGGNVFHYLVGFSPERPWLMEVRKPWNRPPGTRAAAEGVMALTGEDGALDGPRPGEPLLGSSTASMGFDGGQPYERLADSRNGAVAFVFDGVESDTIGDGGPASSAVHQEWDNTEDVAPSRRIEGFARLHLLARSHSATIGARWFGATKRRNRAEMVLSTFESGGAVFSAASMAWCLCLAREDVSRITRNVVDRFLDPASFAG